jgi:hypothetical protein
MTAESTVASWLRDGLLRRIDFRVGGLHIHQPLFHEIASDVAHRRIPLAYRDGTVAEYTSETDTLWLPRSDGGDRQRFRAQLAHEAVHAYCDKHRRRIDFIDEEAAGYLTQVWLLHLRDQGDQLDFGNAAATRIVRAAWDVIVAQRLYDADRAGRSLTRAHIDPLREAILAVPQYERRSRQFSRGQHHDGLRRPPCCQ